MSARKYLIAFVAIALLLAGLVVVFDRVVDPFWYYRDISIDGFNAIKPKFKNYERYVKPAIVQREQPAALIFGSSDFEVGFDPLHPALRASGTGYNFGMAGESWDKVSCDVQFAISHDAALREIVLGIRPQAMPLKDCRAEIDKMEHPEERAFLFSYDALEASINTVLEQHDGNSSHTAEGLYFYTRGLAGTANRFREVFARYPFCDIKYVNAEGLEAAINSRKPEPLDLSGLRDIVRKAAAKGIMMKLVLVPHHALFFEQEYQCGIRQLRWDALSQIVSMVAQEAGDMAGVWDFEGYHQICTEVITGKAGIYWQDPLHFNYEFGNMMLDEMFGINPPVFGIRLTPENLAERAERERAARAAYLKAHPEFLSQLESLLPKHAH